MTLAIAGLGLALTPGVAQADAFSVNEGAVTGADDQDFIATGITGKYVEQVTLGAGTFSATIVVEYTAYTSGQPIVDQIGANLAPAGDGNTGDDGNLYGLYALVTVEGTFETSDGPGTGANDTTDFDFFPETASADLWTDPLRDTTFDFTVPETTGGTDDDQHILTASTILPFPDSNGFTRVVDATGAVVGGQFALVFSDPSLVDPTGPLYWPSLAPLVFNFVSSGDVDPNSECDDCDFPNLVRGDVSSAPDIEQVPEPATLTLFGLGLLGAGAAVRRRRSKG